MKIKDLIEQLQKAPQDHNVLLSAKDRTVEVSEVAIMAYTVFIVGTQTPAEAHPAPNSCNNTKSGDK